MCPKPPKEGRIEDAQDAPSAGKPEFTHRPHMCLRGNVQLNTRVQWAHVI